MRSLIVATLIFLAQPALAQNESEADTRHQEAAWKIAFDMHGGTFTTEQRIKLLQLAWHLAIGNLCDEMHVDQLAFGMALAELEHADGAEASDEEHRFFEQHLFQNLGVAVGIFLAEGVEDPDAACAQAKEEMSGTDTTHYFSVDVNQG